jgi:hypothetical protein
LSRFLVDNGLPLPPIPPEDDATLKNILENVGLGHIKSTLEQFEMKEKETLDLAIPQNEQPPAVETNLLAGNNLDSILMDSDLHFLQINGLEGDSQRCQSHNKGVPSLPTLMNHFDPAVKMRFVGWKTT